MVQKNKRYNIIVTEKGVGELKKISRGMEDFNSSIKKVSANSQKVSKDVGGLRNTFNGFIAAIGTREVARFADEIQLLEDRLSGFANEGETGLEVLEQLNSVAKTTRGSLNGLGEAYNRISISAKDLGLNTEQLLTVTQALQQTFRLSGANTAEINSNLVQFSQGLAQGELRGQELRSVLESNLVYGGLLAERLGVTRGELIRLGEAGQITSKIALSVLFDNFDMLNKKAGELRPTFEQGVTVALNELQLKINELNKEFNLSGGFFVGMEQLAKSSDSVLVAVGGLVASAVIPKLATSLSALSLTPFGAIATGLTGIGIAANETFKYLASDDSLSELKVKANEVNRELQSLFIDLQNSEERASKAFSDGGFLSSVTQGLDKLLGEDASSISKKIKKRSLELSALQAQIKGFEKSAKNIDPLPDLRKKSELEKLNDLYREGRVSIKEFRLAEIELEKSEITKKFDNNKISASQYYDEIEKLTQKSKELEAQTFSLTDAMKNGADEYVKSAGTLAENISGLVSNTFKGLEDQIVNFVKTGKLEFKSLVNSILEDLLRLTIRQTITRQLATGLSSAIGGGASQAGFVGPVQPSANGNVFSGGNIVPFAKGGIVSSPTYFNMPGRNTGLMGEAGPEAIVPISRGKNGKLGINASGMGSNVTINVINNGDNSVSTEEREGPNGDRILDVIITQKVSEGLSSGVFDKSLGQNFGIRRQGF